MARGETVELFSPLHPPASLTMKQLTLKTVALLALSSSDRGQTLHAINVEQTDITSDSVVFIINSRLKTTRRIIKPKLVTCVVTDSPTFNVCDYIIHYMNKTLAYRAAEFTKGGVKPTQLFLSWATKRPVTKQTIARWLKLVLRLAGIQQYSAHSYWGAGLSNAFARA